MVVIAIDLHLKPREASYYIDENSTMYINAPSSVACHPKRSSRVEDPDRVGGPCPGFVLQPLPGRPSVPCPYRIFCRCLPGRVVLGSATTGALPKNFETIFKSEGVCQSV